MKTYRLHFIRHAVSEANEQGVYCGITESPVSAKGRREMVRMAAEFVYPPADKVYVSPLRRCIETAAFLYPEGYARVVPELREMNFGDFEGKKPGDLQDLPEYKEFMKGGLDNPPPNGESLRKVITRCWEGLDFIVGDMMKNGYDSAAIVTHGGIIMNMMGCFGLPKYPSSEYACGFGEGFTVAVSAQMWQQSQAFEVLGMLPYQKPDEKDSEPEDE